MIRLGGLVSQKAFGKFEMGKVISNPSTHGAFMVPVNQSVNRGLQQIGTDVCGDYCKAQDLMREIITEIA